MAFKKWVVSLLWSMAVSEYILLQTHPSVLEKRKTILDETTGLLDNDSNGDNHNAEPTSPQVPETPGVGEFLNKNLILTVTNYCAVAFLSMVRTVLMPLMFSTSIEVGGLGFSPFEIGLIMGVWGLLNATLLHGTSAQTIRGTSGLHLLHAGYVLSILRLLV